MDGGENPGAPAPGDGDSGEEGQGGEEITLTGPRVILGPLPAGCTPQTSEGGAGAVVVVVEVGCDPGRTTTVTVRNDGSEVVAGAALQGTLVPDPAASPPPEPVTASASTSGGECSGPGTTFACTLNIEPGSSTDVVVTYTRPASTVLASRFNLALSLAFAT
ncbi:MAG: hypothetical protein M3124_05655 [Actinomycetota bacterium]|nr:hypothetical protein [Actinomycetota bacterium]